MENFHAENAKCTIHRPIVTLARRDDVVCMLLIFCFVVPIFWVTSGFINTLFLDDTVT